MSSNYSLGLKTTKKYPDVPYDTNGNNNKSATSPKNNSSNVYLNSTRESENGTRFRFDKSVTDGYNAREISPRADSTRAHCISKHNIKQYDDFKEDYDPDYRKNENIFWKDPEKEAKLKKDFYINHRKVSEEEYNHYLDKENITGKSLLRRPSVEDEIRDNARKYYEQNKSRKSSKSVSEIFSKRAQSIEPTISTSKSHDKKSTERHVVDSDSSKHPKDVKCKPSILKDTGDYAPVYKNRHSTYRQKDYNNEAVSPKNDSRNKHEVYFSDTLRKPETERKSVDINTKYGGGYELPSYYRGDITSNNTISDFKKSDNNTNIKISKTFDNSSKYRSASISPTRELRSTISMPIKKKSFFGDDFRPNEEIFHSDGFRISSPETGNNVREISPGYGKKSSVYISDSPHKFSTVPQHVDSRSTSRSIRKSVLDSGHSESLSNGLAYADEEEDIIKDTRNADLMKLYHSKGREYDKDHSAPSRITWSYNKKGVLITDIVDGQPCDNCPEVCSGFHQHPWRKTCQSCKCPRESHAVYQEEWADVRARLGLVATPGQWSPPGLSPAKAEAFLRATGGGYSEERTRRLAHQLPRQDLAAAHCRHLEPKHKASFEDFIAARNEIALDIGFAKENHSGPIECPTCHLSVKPGDLGVVATRLGDDTMFHPACFTCTTCGDILADLAYCALDDRPYCERHYAELLKPRCSACDELIFSGEYTKAMNKDWHSGHFCCWQCDESLTGQRYVLRDDHPYCIKCYESVFANGCEECNKIIGIDSKDLSYKDKHWHEACFLCAKCRVSLVDKQFGSKVDKIYCGNCYDAQFASRCDGCGEVFRAGTKKMEYKTRQWHEKCFCCVVCKTPIGTKSFIPREQEIYCAGCYEEKFATRCVKCNKIITQGGVTYKNEPWHRECFTCTNCSTSLAGQRFTSRDDKPYCAECFGELFAKRCTSCVKPITGIGGTRFISFEDRHWHNDCFICAQCKTSLVGRGFITDAQDIICPECAKQKLM